MPGTKNVVCTPCAVEQIEKGLQSFADCIGAVRQQLGFLRVLERLDAPYRLGIETGAKDDGETLLLLVAIPLDRINR